MPILGIDIGGSGIKGALVDEKTGEVVTARFRIPTPDHAKPDDVAKVVKEIVKHFDYKGQVGIGLEKFPPGQQTIDFTTQGPGLIMSIIAALGRLKHLA